jgi:hypothetical protein
MSGIVGSRFNIRGSGLVGSLGTDGQVFTSSGAGKSAVYEAAAGGGKLLQVQQVTPDPGINSLGVVAWTEIHSTFRCTITPTAADSNLILSAMLIYGNNNTANIGHFKFYDITNSADVNLTSQASSRTPVHASKRDQQTDANDTDSMFMQATVASDDTDARTYSVYFTNEIGGGTYTAKYFFGQTSNASQLGCHKPVFIIMEYES